jgi:hypothetical protein
MGGSRCAGCVTAEDTALEFCEDPRMARRKHDELFEPLLPLGKRHVAYQRLLDSPAHGGARRLLSALAKRMGDPDGRLITNFQGEGFHARLFELACFAFLDAQELAVRRTHERPDFISTRDGKDLAALEVVTANSPLGQNQDIAVSALVDRTKEEIAERCHEEYPLHEPAFSTRLAA